MSDDNSGWNRSNEEFKTPTCCPHIITRIIKSVVTGQAPVTLELRNTPREKKQNQRWYAHMSQLTHFMPSPEMYKN